MDVDRKVNSQRETLKQHLCLSESELGAQRKGLPLPCSIINNDEMRENPLLDTQRIW